MITPPPDHEVVELNAVLLRCRIIWGALLMGLVTSTATMAFLAWQRGGGAESGVRADEAQYLLGGIAEKGCHVEFLKSWLETCC